MATLIKSKQIQGVVTASVIAGDFSISGSLLVSGTGIFTNNITASGIIRATQFIGDGSGLTGVIASGTGITFQSGSTSSTITKLEISGSGAIVSVNSNTASIRIDSTNISSLNAFTQSIDSRVDNLENWSSSFSLANESARYALSSSLNIYEGLLVYQRDINRLWVLKDTSNVGNVNGWEEVLLSNIGAFQIYPTYADLTAVYANYFTDGQIVYVVDTNTLYQAEVIYADFSASYSDSITWNTFTFSPGIEYQASNGLTGSLSGSTILFSLDTGSLHFQSGVEYIISSGSFTIDCGKI